MPPNVVSGTTPQSMTSEYDIGSFPTDFLQLQIQSFDDGLEQSKIGHWDKFLVSTAATYDSSPVIPTAHALGHDDQIAEICTNLVDIFRHFPTYRRFLEFRGQSAQHLLDLLQKLLYLPSLEGRLRTMLYVALFRLCRKSELYPSNFTLTNVVHDGGYPVRDGYFGEIYKGSYYGEAVCLKVVKMYDTSDPALSYKAFFREAVLWGQLSHVNVLPFYGMYRLNDTRERFCLISPWMDNGNVNEFLVAKPAADRRLLISDVIGGILYLHNIGVVHGDLKSANILVSDSERAVVADFGLSSVTDAEGLRHSDLSSDNAEGGTARFQAPELLDPEMDNVRRTKASDIYAFSLVCYEIFTGNHPFPEIKRNYTVMLRVGMGERPRRPLEKIYVEKGLTDHMWTLMEDCWSQLPDKRPNASQVLERLPRGVVDPRPKKSWFYPRPPGFGPLSGAGKGDTTMANALPHLRALLAQV